MNIQNISLSLFKNPEPYHEIVVEIYNDNKDSIEDAIDDGIDGVKDINIGIWINVITTLIISVEKYKKMSGNLKKRVVLEICLISIDESKLNNKRKFYIKTLLNNVLPELIDLLVNLSKKINLGNGKFGKCVKKMVICMCSSSMEEPETEISIAELDDENLTEPPSLNN